MVKSTVPSDGKKKLEELVGSLLIVRDEIHSLLSGLKTGSTNVEQATRSAILQSLNGLTGQEVKFKLEKGKKVLDRIGIVRENLLKRIDDEYYNNYSNGSSSNHVQTIRAVPSQPNNNTISNSNGSSAVSQNTSTSNVITSSIVTTGISSSSEPMRKRQCTDDIRTLDTTTTNNNSVSEIRQSESDVPNIVLDTRTVAADTSNSCSTSSSSTTTSLPTKSETISPSSSIQSNVNNSSSANILINTVENDDVNKMMETDADVEIVQEVAAAEAKFRGYIDLIASDDDDITECSNSQPTGTVGGKGNGIIDLEQHESNDDDDDSESDEHLDQDNDKDFSVEDEDSDDDETDFSNSQSSSTLTNDEKTKTITNIVEDADKETQSIVDDGETQRI